MADTLKAAYRGTLPTSSGTLYTVPAATTFALRSIVVSNSNATSQVVTITLGGVPIIAGATVSANGEFSLDTLQVLNAGDLIAGVASATGVAAHVSGVEVT